MSLSTEPSPSTDPAGLPTDPAAYRRRRADVKAGVGVGSVLIVAVICVAAGGVIGIFAPRLFPAKQVQQLQQLLPHPVASSPAEPPVQTVQPPVPVEVPPAADGSEVAALNDRIERLETGQRRTVAAAGAALAAASLTQASQSSRPFAGELAAVEMLLPDMADINGLRNAAASGAPTRAALAAEYPDFASRAAVAARMPTDGDNLLNRILQSLAAVVTVRRVDHVKGDGPDAVLARAETLVQQGDLESALRELTRLPEPGRNAMAVWRAQAETRIGVDRRVANIRAAATRSLTLTMAGAP